MARGNCSKPPYFPLKKQRLGTAAITDRGDKIQTCDQVAPKVRGCPSKRSSSNLKILLQ